LPAQLALLLRLVAEVAHKEMFKAVLAVQVVVHHLKILLLVEFQCSLCKEVMEVLDIMVEIKQAVEVEQMVMQHPTVMDLLVLLETVKHPL
jgi:hypothetical protein